jgi:hypothetical protein
MLKVAGRIVLILMVAGLISGGLYLWVNHAAQTGVANLSGGDFGEGERLRSGAEGGSFTPDASGDFQAEGHFGGDFDGRDAHGFTLLGVGQHLAVIALITLMVVAPQKIWKKLFRKRTLSAV